MYTLLHILLGISSYNRNPERTNILKYSTPKPSLCAIQMTVEPSLLSVAVDIRRRCTKLREAIDELVIFPGTRLLTLKP